MKLKSDDLKQDHNLTSYQRSKILIQIIREQYSLSVANHVIVTLRMEVNNCVFYQVRNQIIKQIDHET